MVYTYAVITCGIYGQKSEMLSSESINTSADEDVPSITEMSPSGGTYGGNIRIDIKAEDNKKIDRIGLEYRKEGDSDYTLIKELYAPNNNISFNIDTALYDDGIYYYNAYAIDASGNRSDEYIRRYIYDNTGIQKITGLEAECGVNNVCLYWEDVADEDFAYFDVEKYVHDRFVSVRHVDDKTYAYIEGLEPGSEYEFRVTGVDVYGNRGESSDSITVNTLNDENAPYISGIYPSNEHGYNNEIELKIYAEDVSGIAKGIFEYSTDGKEYVTIEEKAVGGKKQCEISAILDVKPFDEGNLYIKYKAEDIYGNISSDEESIVNVISIDKTAPGKVNPDIVSSDGVVIFTGKSDDNDIYYYEIYRSESINGIYAYIDSTDSIDGYTDTDVMPDKSYYYKVKAVDFAGNKSEYSNIAAAYVKRDDQKPQILDVYPDNGGYIGQNSEIYVSASDNNKLSEVVLMYKKEGSVQYEKEFFGNINESYINAKFNIDTAYLSDGVYNFYAYAVDINGNESSKYVFEYNIDTNAPVINNLEAITGHYNIDVIIDSDDDDVQYYDIYRRESGKYAFDKIATIEGTTYHDADVKPGVPYIYKVIAVDKAGNASEEVQTTGYADDVDEIAPVAVIGENIMAITGYEISLDAYESYDNVRIVSYKWDMGNGDIIEGVRPKYTYNVAGEYKVTLTVLDAYGNVGSASTIIKVHDNSGYGMSVITIMDENGNIVPFASVYLKHGNDAYHLKSDSTGRAIIVQKSGIARVAAYKDGYLPSEIEVVISEYKTYEYELVLKKDSLIIGNITVKRMTLSEMKEAGVDMSNSANYNYFVFSYDFVFERRTITIHNAPISCGMAGRGGKSINIKGGVGTGDGINGSTPAGGKVYIEPVYYDETMDAPILACAHITNTEDMEWLKDMFNVSLSIYNNADSNYYIDNSVASLALPDGLSLASLIYSQNSEVDMGCIKGQEEREASWIVRGDKSGSYIIGADFHGVLMPFECDINVHFDCETETYVRNGEGIHIVLMPESTGYMGRDYYVQYKIINESEYPIYNFKTSIGKYEAARAEYIVANISDGTTMYYSGDVIRDNKGKSPTVSSGGYVTYSCIEPGEVIYGTYKTSFPFANPDDDIQVHYYELVDSILDYSEEMGVKISVEPIGSHIGRQVVGAATLQNNYTVGDPIDVQSGFFTDEIYIPSVNGLLDVNFKAEYSSGDSNLTGLMGYGWRYAFDAALYENSGIINLSLGDTRNALFVNEAMSQNVIYGEVIDGNLVISDDEKATYGKYVPLGDALADCEIIKDENGYCLNTNAEYTYRFDEQGRLVQVKDSKERKINFSYDNQNVTVSDIATGEYISYHLNEKGLIDKITDVGGRNTYFVYDEKDNLITYILPDDNKVSISYDDNHRIISESNVVGQYVSNVYDDNNRVTVQTDGRGHVIAMSYSAYDGYRTVNYTGPSQTKRIYVYNDNNQLIKFIDENGSEYEYIYDSNGNEIFERDPNGNVTEKTYDDNGNIISYTDRNYNTTCMTYDNNGNVLSVTGADGSAAYYSYDNYGNIVSYTDVDKVITNNSYDADSNLISRQTGDKEKITYSYTNARVTSLKDSLGNESHSTYDIYGNLITVTDSLSNTTTYTYDNMNRLKSVTDADGNVSSYRYDLNGNIISYIDALGNETRYTYDISGNNTSIIYPDTSKILYEYDLDNRIIKITYPDGTYETRTYDNVGNLIRKEESDGCFIEYKYDSIGQLVYKEDYSGLCERYEYYPNGNLYKTVYPDGSYILNTYNNRWQLVSVTDNNGNGVSYTYDVKGNVTSVTDEEGHKSSYGYDKYSRLVSYTDPNGNKTAYSYDDNDNLIKKTDALGQNVYMDYDALGRMVCAYTYDKLGDKYEVGYGYDALGRVVYIRDEEGNVSKVSYDINGNVATTRDASGNTISSYEYDSMGRLKETRDSSNLVTLYEYDVMGRLTKAITSTADNTRTSAYTYDERGNLVTSVENYKMTSLASYDDRGNVISLTDPNGGVTGYTYDSMDRILSIKSPMGYSSTYSYNAEGLLDSSTNANGQQTKYSYDKCGRISSYTDELGTVRYTYDNNGNVLKVSDENGTISRTYDALNRVTSVTDYNGKTIKYSYDELGHLVSLTYPGGEIVRYEYYRNGKVKAVIDVNGDRTEYSYDENGYLTETLRPNNIKEIRTYENGNLIEIKDITVDADGQETSVINDYHYTYDLFGNITKITGEEAGADGLGNLVSAVCTYDADNRLITYNGETIKYDNEGNMTYGPVDGKIMNLTYDCRNRLVKAGNDTYAYDAENIRISAGHGDSLDVYVTERTAELSRVIVKTSYKTIGDKISSNCEEKIYIYGNGLISEIEDGDTIYHHYNHLGSTTKLSDKAGNIIQSYTYGPYGELLSGDKSYTDYLYNGISGVITEGNGLYYMRQRYYNPEIKRFINQDILTGSIVSPKSLNRYAYVQGNPVSFVDPFGLSPSNAQGGYNFWLGMTHILFGVLGFVPGPVGVAANLADAVVYGFVDHDYYNCMLSVLGAVTCGFAGAAKTSIIAKTVCTVSSATSLSLITANSGYKIGNDLSDIMDCYVFHETSPEELNLGNKLIDIGINTFTIGVSALSAHLTQAEYQKALNSTPSNGNISDKAKWINIEALEDASYKIDDVMIEARNSGMVLEGGSKKTPVSLRQALVNLDKSGVRPGQTEINTSQLNNVINEIQNNYNPSKAYSSVYSDGINRYLVEGHHTTLAFEMLGKESSINMNIVTSDLPSATNIYWTKKWYQFWKKTIKIVED
jgi:RHS repeat-associated protein